MKPGQMVPVERIRTSPWWRFWDRNYTFKHSGVMLEPRSGSCTEKCIEAWPDDIAYCCVCGRKY